MLFLAPNSIRLQALPSLPFVRRQVLQKGSTLSRHLGEGRVHLCESCLGWATPFRDILD